LYSDLLDKLQNPLWMYNTAFIEIDFISNLLEML